jgi:hypothetical protein
MITLGVISAGSAAMEFELKSVVVSVAAANKPEIKVRMLPLR